jgi:hypothetical protein
VPELSARRRRLVLAICCLSLLVVGIDSTIVNVALPSLRRDLGASVPSLQWTIDAYTLMLASFLMLAGSTADRVGRRRTFQTGLASFGLGSLLCSLAPSVGWLIAARATGMRRVHAQSGGPGDHHQHLHRAGRAGQGARHLGRGVRAVARTGTDRRWRSGRLRRVALGIGRVELDLLATIDAGHDGRNSEPATG